MLERELHQDSAGPKSQSKRLGPTGRSAARQILSAYWSGCSRRSKPLARRTLPRYVIWQGNCDVAIQTTRSNVGVSRITISIKYPL